MTVVTLSAGAELVVTPAEVELLSGVVAGGDVMAEDVEAAAEDEGEATATEDDDGVAVSVAVTGQTVVERIEVTVVRIVERSE